MENNDTPLLGNWDLYDGIPEDEVRTRLKDSGQTWKRDQPWLEMGMGPWACSDMWR